jgi:4-hydroxy-2-oxoheptanedioate aldolase
MKNPIRAALAAGQPSVGAWLNLASPLAAEVMAAAGFPWLVVDTEHSAFDMNLIAHTFRAIEARGAIPLARAWDHDPVTIARLLDAGAYGLIIPHVSTPEQARKLAQAMRYPPRGTRSVGTGRCVTLSPDYRKVFDEVVLCIPQIEDLEGIENTEAIARVEGVDIGFLGPADLAMSMGVESGHPDHEAAVQRFLDGCQRAGKPAGIPLRGGAEAVRKRLAQGFRFIDAGGDFRLLEVAAKKLAADLRA